jgi:hypothetical protein
MRVRRLDEAEELEALVFLSCWDVRLRQSLPPPARWVRKAAEACFC